MAPTPEDLGYWDRPAAKKVRLPKFKEDCVKQGIDEVVPLPSCCTRAALALATQKHTAVIAKDQ